MTTPDPRAVLALDLGTSAAKAGVVALDGRLRGDARAVYPLLLEGEAGRAEQDPDTWWDALCEAAGTAMAQAAAEGPVQPIAICCVGQGPTLVPTAADGRPVGKAITWLDRRSGAESAFVAVALGRHGWNVTLLGSARRLAAEAPDVASRAAWFLSAWDHVALRLSGVAATALQDPADAVTADEARLAGLDARSAPPGIRAGTQLGGLLPGPAAELGLPVGLPVVAGVNDAIATFLGAGLTDVGQAIDTGGTSGGFGLYVASPVSVPPLWTGAAPLPGLWYVGGAMAGTGRAWSADGHEVPPGRRDRDRRQGPRPMRDRAMRLRRPARRILASGPRHGRHRRGQRPAPIDRPERCVGRREPGVELLVQQTPAKRVGHGSRVGLRNQEARAAVVDRIDHPARGARHDR